MTGFAAKFSNQPRQCASSNACASSASSENLYAKVNTAEVVFFIFALIILCSSLKGVIGALALVLRISLLVVLLLVVGVKVGKENNALIGA